MANQSPRKIKIPNRACSICGCTEDRACLVREVPCYWHQLKPEPICSACAAVKDVAATRRGRDWLELVIGRFGFL